MYYYVVHVHVTIIESITIFDQASLILFSCSTGSPFRLSIHRNNGQDCVILDHIPSQRDNDRYYLTVNIPSIPCNWLTDQCVLRIWQIDSKCGVIGPLLDSSQIVK